MGNNFSITSLCKTLFKSLRNWAHLVLLLYHNHQVVITSQADNHNSKEK